MGTICTAKYANMFKSKFEERYNYPLIKNKSSSYLHFINNILCYEPNQRTNLNPSYMKQTKNLIP